MNPMVDGWRGDDWFHNGAFRQQNMAYIHDQEATRASETKRWTSHFDDYDHGLTWPRWLVDDRREASGRPDVVVFLSDVLDAPIEISGQPVANLIASTSGTDFDWLVNGIDVSPDEVAGQSALGGYQLMVSADIFRGRYRGSLETARPIAANVPLLYRFDLPAAHHVFLPGHRIMVQVQSSWFSRCDRHPQTFVPNIFWARPGDYRKAVQRISHAPGQASFIELPLVGAR